MKKSKTIKKCVVPGTKIPYVNWIQAWLVSLREKRKKEVNKTNNKQGSKIT